MKPRRINMADLISEVLKAVGDGLSVDQARRILTVKPAQEIQNRVQYLGRQCNEGLLTADEHLEYEMIVHVESHLSILKSKARLVLMNAH